MIITSAPSLVRVGLPKIRPRSFWVFFLTAWVMPLPSAGSPTWPVRRDQPVAPPASYTSAALAAGPGGELYVTLSSYQPSGAIAVEVLRSLDAGGTFEFYGFFGDSNPEHSFFSPALLHLDNPERLVMAMIEQVPGGGYAISVARTLIGPAPDWQLTTVAAGQALIEPEMASDPEDPERLYLIYRSYRVDEGFHEKLDFARSSDGGASWSAPLEIGFTVLPEEMPSAAVLAGPDSTVHVAWVATNASGSSIIYRRHLQAGDSLASFEPAVAIVGPGADVTDIHLGGGAGPPLLALYLKGDGTLRSARSFDAGASFPLTDQVIVEAGETPGEIAVTGEGEYVHLLYRAFGSRLRYRPLLAADSSGVSMPWVVSDQGEPAAQVKVTLRAGVGPAAVWLAGLGSTETPFLEASWFENVLAVESGAPPDGTPPVALAIVPNPFHTRAQIEMLLDQTVLRARVAVVAASGRRVAVVHDGPLSAGRSRLFWDGRSARGELLPAGVYYFEATLPGAPLRARAVLLR